MRLYRFSAVLCSIAALSGCLTHEARISVPAAAAQPATGPQLEGDTTIGAKTFPTPPGPPSSTVNRGPLPQDITVTAWRRDADGLISRGDAEVVTALPWWQRFPCDMATDIVPTELVVRAEYRLALTPVVARTRAQLDQEAAAAGYVTPSLQTTPPASP